jgi:hypothetical protein
MLLAAGFLILFGGIKGAAVPMLIGGMILFTSGVILYGEGVDRYVGETRTVDATDENITTIDYNISTVTADNDWGIWSFSYLLMIGGIVFMLLPFGMLWSSKQA